MFISPWFLDVIMVLYVTSQGPDLSCITRMLCVLPESPLAKPSIGIETYKAQIRL